MVVKICAISDLHGQLPSPDTIPECDILLIAGDICPAYDHNRDFQNLWIKTNFKRWLERLTHVKHIVGTFGNHDFVAEDESLRSLFNLPGYWLVNESVTVEHIKIWGSPYSTQFYNWAFMREDKDLQEIWDTIPEDVDIILVHGPPYGQCDRTVSREHAGSKTLSTTLEEMHTAPIVICGHIHEAYGENYNVFNVSLVNENYKMVNKPTMLQL